MSFTSTVLADLRFALTHPATIRKEILAVATSVGSDVAAFSTLVHLPGNVATSLTAVQAVATFLVTFLAPNQSKAEAKALDAGHLHRVK